MACVFGVQGWGTGVVCWQEGVWVPVGVWVWEAGAKGGAMWEVKKTVGGCVFSTKKGDQVFLPFEYGRQKHG
jgi:hypothetical protein